MRLTLTLVALLLAAPLVAAAQQSVVIPDVEITVNGDTIVINVEVMSDSVRLARIATAVESIAVILAECGCTQPQGTTYVERGVQGAFMLAAFFIGFQLKGIKDNTDHGKSSDPIQDEPPSEDYGEGSGSH